MLCLENWLKNKFFQNLFIPGQALRSKGRHCCALSVVRFGLYKEVKDMKIALCASFMEADLLEERIRSASTDDMIIDEFNTIEAFLEIPCETYYDAVLIAFDGGCGLDAVVQTREKKKRIPIVWISDNERFGLTGYSLQVSRFLMKSCSKEELSAALSSLSSKACMGML